MQQESRAGCRQLAFGVARGSETDLAAMHRAENGVGSPSGAIELDSFFKTGAPTAEADGGISTLDQARPGDKSTRMTEPTSADTVIPLLESVSFSNLGAATAGSEIKSAPTKVVTCRER